MKDLERTNRVEQAIDAAHDLAKLLDMHRINPSKDALIVANKLNKLLAEACHKIKKES